jgi:hypothetical protein
MGTGYKLSSAKLHAAIIVDYTNNLTHFVVLFLFWAP